MYGKIFEDIFCSTLMDCGGDTAYVFIAMIVLSDESGILKHTAESLARAICKDAEAVKRAVTHLEEKDPDSNLKAHEGRRIVPLHELNEDETRGWFVVNKEHYRDKKDLEEIRTQTRERVRRFRERNEGKRDVTLGNAEKRHTDTDTDTDTKNKATTPPDGGPIWTESLSILIAEGNSEKAARGFLGLLCREYDEAEVVNAVKAAVGKVNATAYIRGVLKDRPKKGKTEKRMVM